MEKKKTNIARNWKDNHVTSAQRVVISNAMKTLKRIKMSCFGTEFKILFLRDKRSECGRMFLQVAFTAPCTKTGKIENWKGRKYYLSDYMTQDEIVKTAYVAFKSAVEHEAMEGFKVDGKIVFNPHVNFEALLAITDKEITR